MKIRSAPVVPADAPQSRTQVDPFSMMSIPAAMAALEV